MGKLDQQVDNCVLGGGVFGGGGGLSREFGIYALFGLRIVVANTNHAKIIIYLCLAYADYGIQFSN